MAASETKGFQGVYMDNELFNPFMSGTFRWKAISYE